MSNETATAALAKTATETLVPIRSTEIATTAAASQVRALVEARFTLAVARPRIMMQVRQDLLTECSRPEFALEDIEGKGNSALYRRPVGGNSFIEGLGIRFAEVAVRCMGNLMDDAITLQDTDLERVKYCYVLDLEKNNSWGDTVHITKTVERKSLKEGEVPIKTRRNSKQELVYIVEASEDALATKEAALISKKMRTLILRMIPGDLQDACIQKIREVREKRIMEGPDDAIRAIADLLYKVNVNVVMIEEFLKHPIGQSSPAEIINLQGLYGSLKDGVTSWAEIMANAAEAAAEAQETARREPAGNAGMREKVATAAQGVKPAATPTAPAQTTKTAPAAAQAPTTVAQTAPATAAPAAAGKQPPWMKTKTETAPAQVAETTPEPQQETQPAAQVDSMEEQVRKMAEAKAQQAPAPVVETASVQTAAAPAEPTGPRVAPKNKKIKGVVLPEFADRVGPEDAWTQAQYDRMAAAISNIPGEHGIEQTVFEWIGIPLEQINAATIECIIQVLENWKVKKG